MNDLIVTSDGLFACGAHTYPCIFGKNGFTDDKQEGDGATPRGRYFLRDVYFRADKAASPETRLPVHMIQPDDGWCDDVRRSEYNTNIKLPFDGSHERLWRDDDIYDIVAVIGYNDDPIIPGKGSAFFMHIMRPDRTPTEGCIALTKQDLMEVLQACTIGTAINIG